MPLVIAGWMVLTVGAVGAMIVLATSRLRRRQAADLGTVSDQWIAEQRLGQGHDPHR